MTLIKLKDCGRIQGIHTLPGDRLLVAGGAAECHTELVWVDTADGRERRRELLKFLAEAVAVSVPGDRLVIGRTVHPGLADRSHLYVGSVDGPRAEWERRTVGDWSPDSSAVRVSAAAVAAGPDPVLAVVVMVNLDASALLPTAYEQWLVRVPASGGRPVAEAADRSILIHTAAVSPDGRQVALGGRPTPRPSARPTRVSPEGHRVAIGDKRSVVQIFAGPGEQSARSDRLDGSETRALAFAPDGSRLAVAHGRRGYLIDPATGEITSRIGEHDKQLNAVAFAPDGRRVFTACHDGRLRAWDVASGGLVTEWDFGIGPVTAVAIAPDGLTAAAGGSSGRLVVWDLDP